MGTSRVLVAKRALVKVLVALAAVYSVVLESFSRDSPDKDVLKVFRRVLLRVHPDKGGSTKRPVLGKAAYQQRVRTVVKTKKAQNVARNCALSLRRTCRHVIANKGAATRD